MDNAAFGQNKAGTLVRTIGGQLAFVPDVLPPKLDLAPVQQLLSEADRRIGELKGIGKYLPNPYLLITPLQRSEAIASSNIEGTYTSLSELLLLEAGLEDNRRTTDTLEVYNYISALREGRKLLTTLPPANRVILELHKTLLRGLPRARRGFHEAGVFREDQNFIGNQRDIAKARFVPPPPPLHKELMNDLEKFINAPEFSGFPPLIFMAIIHYQFETIHPFPDGNGRVGRIMIPLLLEYHDIIEHPILYMSQFLEDNRNAYVDLMLKLSQQGDWMGWLEFFLEGVIASCKKTIETIEKITNMLHEYREKCQQARSSALLIQIVERLFERPIITIPDAQKLTGISYKAAQNNIERLLEYGILKAGPSHVRPRYFIAQDLIKTFES